MVDRRIERRGWYLCLATQLMLAFSLLPGCEKSDYMLPFEPQVASRSVGVLGGPIVSGEVDLDHHEAVVPAVVAVVVHVWPGDEKDMIGDEVHNPLFTGVEFDFGDGSGWYDATEDLNTKWVPAGPYPAGPTPTLPDHMTQHTYTAAGDYVIRAQVTFWDGEALISDYDMLVRVLPASTSP